MSFSLIFRTLTLTICQRKVTSCQFDGNGMLVASCRVRAKELSKVISNNIVQLKYNLEVKIMLPVMFSYYLPHIFG